MNSLLKYRVKQLLSYLRIHVRPGGKGRTDLSQLARHLVSIGFIPRTTIDIGVADGTYELYENIPGTHFLLVEPMAEFEPVMKFIGERYDAEYVLAAAGAELGVASVNFGSDLHGASLLGPEQNKRDSNMREIRVVRIDELCLERGLLGPYFIKVDVQGFELDVVEGAKGILSNTEMIVLEASLFSFNEGMPEFVEVVVFMKKLGFVPYDIVGCVLRPLDSALAQLDIAFVKENGLFRQQCKWMTAEQSLRAQNSVIKRVRERLRI